MREKVGGYYCPKWWILARVFYVSTEGAKFEWSCCDVDELLEIIRSNQRSCLSRTQAYLTSLLLDRDPCKLEYQPAFGLLIILTERKDHL